MKLTICSSLKICYSPIHRGSIKIHKFSLVQITSAIKKELHWFLLHSVRIYFFIEISRRSDSKNLRFIIGSGDEEACYLNKLYTKRYRNCAKLTLWMWPFFEIKTCFTSAFWYQNLYGSFRN